MNKLDIMHWGIVEYNPEQNLFHFNEFVYNREIDLFELEHKLSTLGYESICVMPDAEYFSEHIQNSMTTFQDKMKYQTDEDKKAALKADFYTWLAKQQFTDFYNQFLEKKECLDDSNITAIKKRQSMYKAREKMASNIQKLDTDEANCAIAHLLEMRKRSNSLLKEIDDFNIEVLKFYNSLTK